MIYYIDVYNKDGKKSMFLISSDEIIDQILKKFYKYSYKSILILIDSGHRNISQRCSQLHEYLNLIKYLSDEIETLDKEIFNYSYGKHKSEIEILMSVLGLEKQIH